MQSDYNAAAQRASEAAQSQKGRIDCLERQVQALLAAIVDGTATECGAELRALAGSNGGAAAAGKRQPLPPPPLLRRHRDEQQRQWQRRRCATLSRAAWAWRWMSPSTPTPTR